MMLGDCRPARMVGAALASMLAIAGCDGQTYSLGVNCLQSSGYSELQAAVDNQTEVVLCPRAMFVLDAPVVLRRAGNILETLGRPTDPAEMATIMLSANFSSLDVGIGAPASNVHINSVRIDGNRRTLGSRGSRFQLVGMGFGTGYQLINDVFADSPGWTHVHIVEPCDSSMIVGNIIEGGSQTHDATGNFSDGLSISCANTLIANNVINNVSSVGIVYFGGPGTIIRDNTISQTTNGASSGINVGDAVRLDHTGVVISGNTVKATAPGYFDIGMAAGLRVWLPLPRQPNIMGITVTNNTISGMTRYGLAVDGCLSCDIENNQVLDWQALTATPTAGCPPPAAYVANVSGGHADGNIQAGYVDANIDGCVGLPNAAP
ncbi:MAG TPA: right-handed parallel beta-helix repeat-containing protein [Polyangia bacterium]|jgi:hypothetical protein